MHHIKGQQRNQLQMLCLEQVVAEDSFVRIIDLFVDSIDLKSFGIMIIPDKRVLRQFRWKNQLIELL